MILEHHDRASLFQGRMIPWWSAKLMPSGDCSTTYQASIPSPRRSSYNEGRVVLTYAARGGAGQPG